MTRVAVPVRPSTRPAPAFRAPPVERVVGGSGRPLDSATRSDLEPRLGHDFGRVRVHDDRAASASALALGADAYTVGDHVVFGPGRYDPGSSDGRRLLAHELAHVVQQDAAPASAAAPAVAEPGSALEREAAAVAEGRLERPRLRSPRPLLQRKMSEQCFALSLLLSPVAAAGFGILAEKFVQADYESVMSEPASDHYFDDSFAGPIDPDFAAFIVRKNPGLSSWKVLALATVSPSRPDILAHTSKRQDFYEVKPDSAPGRAAGRTKIAAIEGFMSLLSLPYVAGTTYTPTSSIAIGSTSVGGIPINVSLGLRRSNDGLVVYELCIETEWDKLLEAAVIAAVIALLIVIAAGAGVPIPAPA